MKEWRQYAFQFMMIGSFLYVILTTIAMLTYPGGTYDDPNTRGYSFFTNFFSDLARTVTFSGESNFISWILSTSAFIFVGVALILSYTAWPVLFKSDQILYRMSIIGSVSGIISGVGFIGVAFTPWDLLLEPHILFVNIGFLSSAVAIVFYTWILHKKSDYPKRYEYTFGILVAFLIMYLLVLFFGSFTISDNGLLVQVTAQKIIVYSMGICYFFQGYGATRYWNAIHRSDETS